MIENLAKNQQETKDEIGSESSTAIAHMIQDELLLAEEGPAKATQQSIENSFILGHSTYGILGTRWLGVIHSFTLDHATFSILDSNVNKLDRWAGDSTILYVVNPNKVFIERFRTSTFKDSDNTSAYWNTVNYRLSGTSATGVSTAQTLSIAYNDGTASKAVIYCDETIGGTGITYWLSADGGTSWTSFGTAISTAFTNAGRDIRLRIRFEGGTNTYIENLKVDYS